MLKKQIQKEKKTSFDLFIKEKSEKAQLKKIELIKNALLNPHKDNQFKDLRTLKTKLHSVANTKTSKKKKFDLNSDDETENITSILKHKGQPLELMDDFNEEIEKSSVDDDLDKEYVSELHFGGFDDGMNDPSKHTKTKQEIYKEIIKKSKKMRYEKQKLREENLDKVDEIDQDQETMKKILELKMTKDERKAAQQQHHEEEDDYDKLTKELYSEGKTYANNVSLKDPKKLKNEAKQKKNKRTEKIFSDDEENEEENDDENDDEFQNDDELEENLKTEKRKVGHDFDKKQKKTAKINSFLTKLQEIKREKMGNNELSSSNSEEDLEPSSDQEDSEDESIEAYS